MLIMDSILREVIRCPQCGTARPTLEQIWQTDKAIACPEVDHPRERMQGRHWALYICTYCTKLIMAEGYLTSEESFFVRKLYPSAISVEDELPPAAKRYLEQAMESLNAPDGAAMLSGSAVDQMLKAKGLKEGSVYARIEQAVKDGLITEDMGEWAHHVRLGANRPRHADLDNPHVQQSFSHI